MYLPIRAYRASIVISIAAVMSLFPRQYFSPMSIPNGCVQGLGGALPYPFSLGDGAGWRKCSRGSTNVVGSTKQ